MKYLSKIILIFTIILSSLVITCVNQKRQTVWYDFICWLPDGEGGENTLSGRINDLNLQKDVVTFTGPDGKKVLFSNIKCVFKESILEKR